MSVPRASTSRHASASRPTIPQLLPSILPHELSSRPSTASLQPASHTPSMQRADPSQTLPMSNEDEIITFTETPAQEEPEETLGSHQYPHFEPFFTLIEDNHSSTSHHPAVHYIFSDDDGDVLNDALLRISAERVASMQRSRATTSGPRERYVVVSLGEDGRCVTSAQSLTGDWQVLGAEVNAAPTLEGGEGETGGLMLRLQGIEGMKEESHRGGYLDAEAVIERFRERMEELKRIVEAGKSSPMSALQQT